MSLNIKNAETHKLARELATLTGESVTEAVTVAVRERLSRVRRVGLAERLREISLDAAKRWKEPYRSMEDPTAFLYDERGLPK